MSLVNQYTHPQTGGVILQLKENLYTDGILLFKTYSTNEYTIKYTLTDLGVDVLVFFDVMNWLYQVNLPLYKQKEYVLVPNKLAYGSNTPHTYMVEDIKEKSVSMLSYFNLLTKYVGQGLLPNNITVDITTMTIKVGTETYDHVRFMKYLYYEYLVKTQWFQGVLQTAKQDGWVKKGETITPTSLSEKSAACGDSELGVEFAILDLPTCSTQSIVDTLETLDGVVDNKYVRYNTTELLPIEKYLPYKEYYAGRNQEVDTLVESYILALQTAAQLADTYVPLAHLIASYVFDTGYVYITELEKGSPPLESQDYYNNDTLITSLRRYTYLDITPHSMTFECGNKNQTRLIVPLLYFTASIRYLEKEDLYSIDCLPYRIYFSGDYYRNQIYNVGV